MKEIILSCKVITPLFMGGAEQQPELRTQSFNGLFRYWFRLLGGYFEDEKRLFGWGGEKANKGIVNIKLKRQNVKGTQPERQKKEGYNYLGFSLKLTRREGIDASNFFKILLSFHPKSTEDDIKKFLCAVWCAFYLGNFGSRSRRGFGSIVVENVNGYKLQNFDLKFKPNQSIKDWLKEQINYIKSLNFWRARKDIPYIFENMEIWRVQRENFNKYGNFIKDVQQNRRGRYLFNSGAPNSIGNLDDLLDFIGFLLAAYRSYYKPDYDIVKSILENPQKFSHSQTIKRVVFGLPLNFYFSSLKKVGQVGAKLGSTGLRRASPLIFKVIQFDGNFEGFILLFKPNNRHDFKFLPDGAQITLKGVNLKQTDWQILNDFIEKLAKHNLITTVYP